MGKMPHLYGLFYDDMLLSEGIGCELGGTGKNYFPC